MLPTLFTGYRCFADSFSRFCAGKYLPVPALASCSSNKRRVNFFPATTAALCIAITNSFQHYLLGIGLLRTRAGDMFRLGLAPSNICDAPRFGRHSLIYLCWVKLELFLSHFFESSISKSRFSSFFIYVEQGRKKRSFLLSAGTKLTRGLMYVKLATSVPRVEQQCWWSVEGPYTAKLYQF